MSDARDPVRLSLRLISTSRLIEREVDSLMRARFDSTIARFDFLSALDRHGALTLGEVSQYLLVSNGNVTQLRTRLSEDGLIETEADENDRPAILIYAGDFDPSGEDIARDFVERVDAFSEVVSVAVTPEQVGELGLTPMPGKRTDARAASFQARHGQLVQVEVEAVHPDTLRGLYQGAVDAVWDTTTYERVLAQEASERDALREFLESRQAP